MSCSCYHLLVRISDTTYSRDGGTVWVVCVCMFAQECGSMYIVCVCVSVEWARHSSASSQQYDSPHRRHPVMSVDNFKLCVCVFVCRVNIIFKKNNKQIETGPISPTKHTCNANYDPTGLWASDSLYLLSVTSVSVWPFIMALCCLQSTFWMVCWGQMNTWWGQMDGSLSSLCIYVSTKMQICLHLFTFHLCGVQIVWFCPLNPSVSF